MINCRFIHSKKAISPILATLLLVVIAVAAIVMTYAWMNSYMGSTTDNASVIPYKANVAFLSAGKSITVDIGNSGSSSTEIIGVYIGTSETATTKQTTSPTTLTLDGNSVTSFKVTYTWKAGETYYFKIVTAAGTPLTFQEQAPPE
ncbi:MAG: archaellin/type IV pilin N-terminal domain-containing protein [Candidatus Bathyarchaeia archaeon]|jgi:flagellin-like protein